MSTNDSGGIWKYYPSIYKKENEIPYWRQQPPQHSNKSQVELDTELNLSVKIVACYKLLCMFSCTMSDKCRTN